MPRRAGRALKTVETSTKRERVVDTVLIGYKPSVDDSHVEKGDNRLISGPLANAVFCDSDGVILNFGICLWVAFSRFESPSDSLMCFWLEAAHAREA
jgi:hypothetical protein